MELLVGIVGGLLISSFTAEFVIPAAWLGRHRNGRPCQHVDVDTGGSKPKQRPRLVVVAVVLLSPTADGALIGAELWKPTE